MRLSRKPVVPELLVDRIDEALAAVDAAGAALAAVTAARAPLAERREAHRTVTHAFDHADALLREATALAKQHSYREWSLWRERLSSLDTARQLHLLAEQDEPGLRPSGSVRAIDTGMSGPDIGELQHGESRPSGSVPNYGVDVEALLTASDRARGTAVTQRTESRVAPLDRQPAVDRTSAVASAPSGQAA